MTPRARVLTTIRERRGRAAAITSRQLALVVRCSDREARRLVSELRREGYPIASAVHAPYGFYWPETPEEARECQAHLYSRIRELAETAKALDKAFGAHLPGRQMVLDIFGEGA